MLKLLAASLLVKSILIPYYVYWLGFFPLQSLVCYCSVSVHHLEHSIIRFAKFCF